MNEFQEMKLGIRLNPGLGLPTIVFEFGAVVYLRLREEKVAGMVTGYLMRPTGVVYQVSWSNTGAESGHYEMELSGDFEPYSQ